MKLVFLKNFIAYILRTVLKCIPRNKSKWVFGATNSFRDNPKYLFYWTIENHPEIRAIWISRNKSDVSFLWGRGFEAYYRNSLKGLYHTLTSKVFISDHHIDDINKYLSGGAFYVNLWHGVSVKKVRWQAPDYYVKNYGLRSASQMRTSFKFKMEAYPSMFVKPDLLLAPSKTQAEMFFSHMLDVPLSNCLLSIPPRSRLMVEGKESVAKFVDKYEPEETSLLIKKFEQYNKVYIYMPTWRNDEYDFVTESGIDWELLSNALKQNNALLLLRLHIFTKLDFSSVMNYDNIMVYPSLSDIYTILPFVNCLITDYSSVYTDFLIMNKEVILFVYDYDKFVKESHELMDYDKYYIGQRAYDFGQLLNLIENNKDCHIPQEKCDSIMRFYWDCNEHNVDIVEEIKGRLNK